MTERRPERLQALCVFCGSSIGAAPAHRDAADRLGRALAAEGVTLVFGGGHSGLMGVVAEAALKSGGRVVGVIPGHLMPVEEPFREISELIVVDSMHTRKRRMFDLADGFCVLPGGLGTMDETFEMVTWKQLRLHNKPIVIANIAGYWDRWLSLMEGIVAGGFARPELDRLYSVVDSVDDVLPTARQGIDDAFYGKSQLM
jgi:hypothetical protein